MVPLFAESPSAREYVPLAQAVADGSARISEISEGGSVGTLTVVVSGERPVLLLDGEELIGAKQNRIVNLTILAPAKKELHIPVSCVEHGRWGYQRRDFMPAPHAMFAAGRARKSRDVTRGMVSEGVRMTNQHAVWDDVAEKSRKLGVHSPTGAMHDVYARRHLDVESYVEALAPMAGQVGAVWLLRGEPMGLELFDDEQTLREYFPKLVRSWALDAIETTTYRRKRGRPLSRDAEVVEEFLASIGKAKQTAMPALGLGEDVRFDDGRVTGGALVVGERVVHLAAFRVSAVA